MLCQRWDFQLFPLSRSSPGSGSFLLTISSSVTASQSRGNKDVRLRSRLTGCRANATPSFVSIHHSSALPPFPPHLGRNLFSARGGRTEPWLESGNAPEMSQIWTKTCQRLQKAPLGDPEMRDKRRDARASGDVWLLVPESAVAAAGPGAYAATRQDYRRVCVCVCVVEQEGAGAIKQPDAPATAIVSGAERRRPHNSTTIAAPEL